MKLVFCFLRSSIPARTFNRFEFPVGFLPDFVGLSLLGSAHTAADDKEDYEGDGAHGHDDTQADPLAEVLLVVLTFVAPESSRAAEIKELKLERCMVCAINCAINPYSFLVSVYSGFVYLSSKFFLLLIFRRKDLTWNQEMS